MKLTLTRPLCVFDLEATEKNPAKARICSISVKKIFPDGTTKSSTSLVNPGIPIPAEATEVHGITNEMVASAPTFKQISKSVFAMLQDSDVLGYNSSQYDIVLLAEEFARVELVWPLQGMLSIDACTIFKKHEERTLTAALKFFCGKEHDNAHSAEADVQATFEVFESQLERYPDMGEMTIQQLHDYCVYDPNRIDLDGKLGRNEQGIVTWTFGKNVGKPVVDDLKYCEWVLGGEFTMQTKSIVREIYNKAKGIVEQTKLL